MAREMNGTTKCGWCITSDHDHCRGPIEYFGRTFECGCECSKSESKKAPPRRRRNVSPTP